MAKYIKYQWASSGDVVAVPDATQGDGSVSYQTGYGAPYSIAYGSTGYKAIERTKLNGALNDITGVLQQYQGNGFPDFITSAQNGGTAYSYSLNAMVRYDNGTNVSVYRSLKNSNTSLPTVIADWALQKYGRGNPCARAISSTNQTVSPSTWTKVVFSGVIFDTTSNFASSRFTATVAGYYNIISLVGTAAQASGTLAIYKNGTNYSQGMTFSTGTSTTLDISDVVPLSVGDYVEIYIFTGATTVATGFTRFSIALVEEI